MRRLPFMLLILVAVAATPVLAGDMTLSRANGDLYRVDLTFDGLIVTHRSTDGAVDVSAIPQTTGINATSLNLAFDEETDSLYVLWERTSDYPNHLVEFATRVGGTWYGPFVLAGGDGTDARNCEMLLHRVATEVEVGSPDEPLTELVETTFLHMVWWTHVREDEAGTAMYIGLPLDADGMPEFGQFAPRPLADLLPYGIGCSGIGEEATRLTHPKLFFDPQTGAPHVLATDFSECLFQILRIIYEVEIDTDPATGLERRRHIADWRSDRAIAVNPDLPLEFASAIVGHDLSIVLYWDSDEQTVSYMQLTEDEASDIRDLPLDGIDHEQAVGLIRELARR